MEIRALTLLTLCTVGNVISLAVCRIWQDNLHVCITGICISLKNGAFAVTSIIHHVQDIL